MQLLDLGLEPKTFRLLVWRSTTKLIEHDEKSFPVFVIPATLWVTFILEYFTFLLVGVGGPGPAWVSTSPHISRHPFIQYDEADNRWSVTPRVWLDIPHLVVKCEEEVDRRWWLDCWPDGCLWSWSNFWDPEVEEKRSRDRSKGEGAMYEWQGRPPHERAPGHLARF